jgi:hypothetical protein
MRQIFSMYPPWPSAFYAIPINMTVTTPSTQTLTQKTKIMDQSYAGIMDRPVSGNTRNWLG